MKPMLLWTIQPLEIYEHIMTSGEYYCDIEKSQMIDVVDKYEWLVNQMEETIGPPPEGVTYPVWAWYVYHGRHAKPDLRHARWEFGSKSETHACIEFEIDDSQVVLSDFDEWCIILNNGLLADTEAESDLLDKQYETLSEYDRQALKYENWKRVFNIEPLNNGWMRRGEDIQATFWVLRKEMIKDVRFFTAAAK